MGTKQRSRDTSVLHLEASKRGVERPSWRSVGLRVCRDGFFNVNHTLLAFVSKEVATHVLSENARSSRKVKFGNVTKLNIGRRCSGN